MKAIVTLLLASLSWTPISTTQDFEVYSLGSRSYALKTRSGLGNIVGSNSGFIQVGQKVVVIDTHMSSEVELRAQKAIMDAVGTNVVTVINTHFHGDHVGGNSAYPLSVPVWAHESSAEELRKREPTRPYESINDDQPNWRGEDIDIISIGNAHSTGDIVVFDRRDKVLYTGDVFVNGYVGYLSEAHFAEWIRALKKLEGLGADAIVPGHGPIATTADMTKYRIYLEDFVTSARAHFDAGGSPTTYVLPEKYQQLGAQFYLAGNVEHAYELWKLGQLKF